MDRVSVEKSSVETSPMGKSSVIRSKGRWGIRAILMGAIIGGAAAATFHFADAGPQAHTSSPQSVAHAKLSASSLSIPLFFEPNLGQTDPQVKFIARGSGYGLFLTANEAVLELQQSSHVETRIAESPAAKPAPSVIRMRLHGANASTRIQGSHPLPGKSNYFIGNDRSKWRQGIPQFARVEYQSVYPGVDLVYYGNQRQLEYDFRVAPGADANQIALSFQGATARLDSGDLVLSTAGGDVRFHAPHIYQSSIAASSSNTESSVEGSFRQLADNKIGFTIGPYDHSRELVIDPVLSYSTYLGPTTGAESLVKVAVDFSNHIWLAGSTTATNFPAVNAYQSTPAGQEDIFIAVLDPAQAPASQLVYATYLGGSGSDSLAGLAVDPQTGFPGTNVYVAGTTTSPNFPTTANAFQQTPLSAGTHGFLSKLAVSLTGTNQLTYSTYLSGNGTDSVSGLAVDANQNAYLTGVTNSSNPSSDSFPANQYAFQLSSNSPGFNQFFASKIATVGFSGTQSMLYSTYFGGGNPPGALVIGGGVAADVNGNLYFTGATNLQSIEGVNQTPPFPIFNAYQNCLNQMGLQTSCTPTNPNNTDAILVKLDTSQNHPQSPPFVSTYLGGRSDDAGVAIALDTTGNAYITGKTNSGDTTSSPPDWNCTGGTCTRGAYGYQGTNNNSNAFIAKVSNQTQPGTIFPLSFFTWLGGSGPDIGQAIVVDSAGTVHLAGTTFSVNPPLPVTQDALQFQCAGSGGGVCTGDAFAALIATSATTTGNYITYLGGANDDQGTGIALDNLNAAYVAGSTQSGDFPVTPATAYQPTLQSAQNAFATKIGNSSDIAVAAGSTSPNPKPVAAGQAATFTFELTNNGTDPASNINFFALVPTSGLASTPTATVTSGGGNCNAVQNGTIPCFIPSLAVGAKAVVTVSVTPAIPPPPSMKISVACNFNVNGGASQGCPISQEDDVVDFTITATTPDPVAAGDMASIGITLTPNPTYNATITMSQTTTPTMVTSTSPTFTNPTVTLSGSGQGSTTLNIQTVARPVTKGSLLRGGPFYATWLPIGGLSLVGLGLGASRKRRRWLAGLALGLLAGLILLQPACGSSSKAVNNGGGTAAGPYTITIKAAAGTTASHQTVVTLIVK